MTAHGFVPEELKRGPFTVAEARAYGVTQKQLRSAAWRRIWRGWYRWVGCPMNEDVRLTAILAGLPPGSAFAGRTAARLLGLDVTDRGSPEVLVPRITGVAERVQANVSRARLEPEDITWREGVPVTAPLRTCFDLAGRLPLVEGVVVVDQALHKELFDLPAFAAYVGERDHVAGVVGARRTLEYAEPKTESPMETRLRMLLVNAGLPRPEAQVNLCDAAGRFAGRADFYYEQARLAIEYDGENHRDRLTNDNRRQNHLLETGVTLLRYTAPDLAERPDAIVAEVRSALARRHHGPLVHL